MSDDRLQAWARLAEQGEALLRDARSAAQVTAAPGSDATGSVSVTLDSAGRVAKVAVLGGWKRRLGAEDLAGAVVEAVRNAAVRRLTAWGRAYGEGTGDGPVTSAAGTGADGSSGHAARADRASWDRGDFERRLHEAATGRMSGVDGRAALVELLELAEGIERGIDEVSGKLRTTLDTTHTGHSPDRHVTVTLTGGGDVTAVRFDRAWLREAHEINVARQLTAAFGAAYEKVAAHGVDRLIADSALGAVQRDTRDPLGLAHRLRASD